MVWCDLNSHEDLPKFMNSPLASGSYVWDQLGDAEGLCEAHVSVTRTAPALAKGDFVDCKHTWWCFCHWVGFDCVNNWEQLVPSLTWIDYSSLCILSLFLLKKLVSSLLLMEILDSPQRFLHPLASDLCFLGRQLLSVCGCLDKPQFLRVHHWRPARAAALLAVCHVPLAYRLLVCPSWSHSEELFGFPWVSAGGGGVLQRCVLGPSRRAPTASATRLRSTQLLGLLEGHWAYLCSKCVFL